MIIEKYTGMKEPDKLAIDVIAAIASVGGFLFDALPHIALLLTIVWTFIRIFETDTVRQFLGKKDAKETSDD